MGPAPGAHRRDRPRLRPARDADAAPAGEAHHDRADVPLRPAPGRPLPPVLAVRRRSDRRPGTGDRCRDHRARPPVLHRGRRDRRRRSRSTRSATRTAVPPTSRSSPPTTADHAATSCPPTERDRLERNALRLLDSKDPAMAELNAAAPRITDRLCDACAAHFEAVKAHLTRGRRAVAGRAGARPRPRLLHADGVRVSTSPGARASSRRSVAAAATTASCELLGGKPTPGIGFGLGLDRVASCSRSRGRPPPWSPGRSPWSSGADPDDTVARLRVATDLRAARAPRPRGPRAGGSSGASSRRRVATARTSR